MSKLAHCVYFTLNDDSDSLQESLIAAGNRFLKPHDGVMHFEMGQRNRKMQREVNDQSFDVSLIIIFDSQASHDAYQVSQPHGQFIDEQKANWKAVRVFDSNLAP